MILAHEGLMSSRSKVIRGTQIRKGLASQENSESWWHWSYYAQTQQPFYGAFWSFDYPEKFELRSYRCLLAMFIDITHE